MKKIRNYSLVMMSLLAFSMAKGQTVNSFSVQQASDYAKKNAVQVKNSLLDVLIQKQTNRDVTSIALPQINGNGSLNDYLQIPTTLLPGEIVGQPPGTFVPVKFGTKWNASTGVSLSQIVFDGQVFIALKARNGTITYMEQIEKLTEENIIVNVHKVYYQLLTGKTQVTLIDANIALLEKLKHDFQIMYDNGFAERLEIDKATVQLANLQSERLRANNLIANGYTGLKVLMGMPVKDSLVLTDTLDDNTIREGVLEASQYKYTDRKDFQISETTNKLNALNVRRYKLSQLPSLSFVGNYAVQAQRSRFDFFGKGDWFNTSYVGLQLRVPIFSGFSLRAKTQKARLELQKSKNQTEALKINIDSDVEQAKNTYISAIASMDFQKKNMELAQKVYGQTKKKFEIGTGDATTINAAQTDLKSAQTNYLNALSEAIIAKIDFLKATGKFN